MADENNQQSSESSNAPSENIQIPPISKEAAGAAAGAVVGSVVGPVGAVVGGVIGAALGRSARPQSAAPVKKAADQSIEAALQAFNLPTRTQVTSLAKQIMDLEERLDRLEDGISAVLRRLEGEQAR